MVNEPDILRLPKRLFDGGYFHLPLKPLGDLKDGPILRFPESQLSDPGLQRFVFEEFHKLGFESRERAVLGHFLPNDAIFIDVGAHFGLYPLVLCEHFSGILCIAIEPSPANFSILVENMKRAGFEDRVRCLEYAAGSAAGSGRLRLNSSMGHHLSTHRSGTGASEVTVEVRRLDSLLSDCQSVGLSDRPVWLKVDAEGRELDVLGGGRQLLGSGRVDGVLWEYRVGPRENPRKAEILNFLKEFGFASTEITDGSILSLRNGEDLRMLEDI